MIGIQNKQGITFISMYPTAYTKCVIGQDWYKNELEINYEPGEVYPDYMDVDAWIMENIDGKELNIEDVVQNIFDLIVREYQPKRLEVVDHIKGCKTHFNVTVKKSNF